MANANKNEQKLTDNVEASETAVTETNETTVTEVKPPVQLFVERILAKDKYGKQIKTTSGEPLYNYVMKGKVRSKDIKIDFATPDKGGYEALEFVYFGANRAELSISVQEMVRDGKKSYMTKYEVFTIDEDGIVYKAEVKPARKSDTNLLDMYLNTLAKTA